MSYRTLLADATKSWVDIKVDSLNASGAVDMASTLDVAGLITASAGVDATGQNLTVDTITAVTSIDVAGEPVAGQDEGSHVTNWSGAIAATAGDVDYVKEGSWVTLDFPNISVAATAASTITASAMLPAELRPSTSIYFAWIVEDNSTSVAGRLHITSSGSMIFSVGAGTGAYTNTGDAGFFRGSVRFKV